MARKYRRKSMSKGSIDNVMTVIKKYLFVNPKDYDLHINFPGGTPIDGPSAGITIACAVYSAITKKYVSNEIAMTGELSIRGYVKPIGGVIAKIDAAKKLGLRKFLYQRITGRRPSRIVKWKLFQWKESKRLSATR